MLLHEEGLKQLSKQLLIVKVLYVISAVLQLYTVV